MAMKRCPVCGEKYSDTAYECPFCKEADYWESAKSRVKNRSSKRSAKHSKQFLLIANTLMVSIIIVASSLVYLLRDGVHWVGDSIQKTPESLLSHVAAQSSEGQDPVPEDSEKVNPQEEDVSVDNLILDYETAEKLPDGLELIPVEITLNRLGQAHTIRAFGSNTADYQWISEDDRIVSVEQNGKIKALSEGTAHVLVTDGSKKGVCVVRVSVSDASAQANNSDAKTSDKLEAGPAKVTNAESGVRVRSGPGTSYEALISIYNGGSVQVVRDAGDGWYEIIFYNARGIETTGYMKGEFLQAN